MNARRRRTGVYVELQSRPGEQIPELTWMSKGLRLGAVRTTPEDVQVASLFVPDSALAFLQEKLDAYTNNPLGKRDAVPFRDRFEQLGQISVASLESLWTDRRSLPEDRDAKVWWECWTWRDLISELTSHAQQLDFQVSTKTLRFPDIEIIPLHGSATQIEQLIGSTSAIEQLRYASDSPTFFTTTVQREQHPWVDDLVDRIATASGDSPVVCLLDTGVARAHPLIIGSLDPSDCLTCNTTWGVDDSHPLGHGTNMAGSILFSDLTHPLSDQSEVTLPFSLESVKLFPPSIFTSTEPENYGSITQSAVSIAEINAPERERTFCMAITNLDVSGESPTSWSAALDQICSGSMTGDPEEPERRRLFFVSAGNIGDHCGPDELDHPEEFPVEDPAQSWNAISVGGFTNKVDFHVDDPYADWSPLAEVGSLSPYSRISSDWIHSRTPIKPEIVFEAGNRALSPAGNELLSGVSSLSLLTTAKDFLDEPLITFWATSAATAQAAGMAGHLMAHDPSWWPETVRALMIHSASWTSWMRGQMDACANKADKIVLARNFGYGVPSLSRALSSAENDLFMISQAEITPYYREEREDEEGNLVRTAPKMKDLHVYQLPWPIEALQTLGAKDVHLKVTLSYFVEPNLGDKTPVLPNKYRSCGLRFQMRRAGELEEDFIKRINDLPRDPEETLLPAEDDPKWHFGSRSISAGSLHTDTWTGSGAELALRNQIAIVPVGGWWKDLVRQKRYDLPVRYALILSITTADQEALLYSEVEQKISIATEIQIDSGLVKTFVSVSSGPTSYLAMCSLVLRPSYWASNFFNASEISI